MGNVHQTVKRVMRIGNIRIFCWLLLVSHVAFSQGAGDFVKYEKKGTDLIIYGTKANLLLQSFSPNIFKVQWLKPAQTPFDSSYCVVLKPQNLINQVSESTKTIELTFEKCVLEITKFPIQIALKSGNQIKIKEADGFRQTADSVFLSFALNPNDVFHGAGARPFGLDLKRKVFDFYNTYEPKYFDESTGLAQSLNIPFVVSSHKYGLFLDSDLPGSMRMSLGGFDSTKIEIQAVSSGKWAYYLINGDSNDEILQNYTLLTGRQPLPPRWAFGYIQSRFGYKTESEARGVVDKLRTQGFPLDALVLDLYWYGDEKKMGNLDWDTSSWPTSTQMMKDFASKGVKTILITDPYVTKNSFNFRLADSLGYFALNSRTNQSATIEMWNGTVGLLDIFKPKTQNWLWQNYKRLTTQGVGGWWCDKVEPETHPQTITHALGSAVQTHNLYPLFWAKNLYENFRKDFPNKRLFNLTRSGWAGSQRYGALPWSGDVMRYWAGLKLQMPIMLQAGMSGLGYMHADVGGFFTDPDQKEKNEELDLRWLQFATFSPIVRTHGMRSNTEPYYLSEPFYSIVKNYLKIRYQLLPYVYSLAWQNSTTGRPICLPMDYFDFSKTNGTLIDQYFFGENMLVAPVLLHGMPLRKVVLPKGKWFNYWTNQLNNGETNVFEPLTMDHIPVFAKAGSLIPLASAAKMSTDYYSADSLTIKFFQDISVQSATFTMFHDDGNDPNVLTNQRYELLDFIGKTWQDSVQVETIRRKSFDGGLATRAMIVEVENLTSIPKLVKINNQAIPVVFQAELFTKDNLAYYNTAEKQLKVRYQWNCTVPTKVVVLREGLSILTATEEPLADVGRLTVYPNPSKANAEINIEAQITETGNYHVEIIDAVGVSVYQRSLGKQVQGTALSHSLNTAHWRGVFLVRLQHESGKMMIKKIVIN